MNGDALTVVWKVDGITAHTDNVPASQNSTTLTLNQKYGAIGTHPVSVTVTDSKNASANCSTSANVVQAPQTINFGALPDRFYGDAPFTISATATSGLPVSFTLQSGPVTLVGNSVTITGTGLVTIVASQDGDANYLPAPNVPQSFEVKKTGSTVTVTCPAAPQTYTGSAITPCTHRRRSRAEPDRREQPRSCIRPTYRPRSRAARVGRRRQPRIQHGDRQLHDQ